MSTCLAATLPPASELEHINVGSGALAGTVTSDMSHHPSVVVSLCLSFSSPPQLPPRRRASCHPPKVIAIYRVALICQSQPDARSQQGHRLGQLRV